MQRKVLLVEHEPLVRNLIYALLGSLQSDNEFAFQGQQALATIQRADYDAVLLDLRYKGGSASESVAGIGRLQPSLVGRLLCITGETSDAATFGTIERSCRPSSRTGRTDRAGKLFQELWERLRLFLRPAAASSQRI